eukprot:TRINITY_DN69384_c0_g1_i1.p1 TRINITY_DN69384_c0_g1~~TRINITY_DN69384_c0_g1_i1.p1  ORF type:complete len:596 (-),score=95.40 TRINITY_DN69384_c0_g1_i1:178-1926(-)
MSKRRPAAAASRVKSRPKDDVVGWGPLQLVDTFEALKQDLNAVERLQKQREQHRSLYGDDDDDEDDVSDDSGERPRRKRRQKKASFADALRHMREEASRIQEEIRTFGYVRNSWQPYDVAGPNRKRRKLQPKPGTEPKQAQQVATVVSFCKNASGEPLEFSRIHVPLPQHSADGLRLQMFKNMKLQHPDQVQVTTSGKKTPTRDGGPLPAAKKIVKVPGKSNALEVALHYPVRTSVFPASVDILTLEVAACRTWKDDGSIMDQYRMKLSSLLKDLAEQEGGSSRGGNKLLKFSWLCKVAPETSDYTYGDGLIVKEHGFWEPHLQIRDVSLSRGRSTSQGTLLLDCLDAFDLGVAVLGGGVGLADLREEASRIPSITVTQALTGKRLFDINVEAENSVQAIEDELRRRLRDDRSEFKYVNRAGVVIEPWVRAGAVNQCKKSRTKAPVTDHATPQRLFILEFTAAKSNGKAKVMNAQSAAAAADFDDGPAQDSELYGVIFIEDSVAEGGQKAIILTKGVADANRLMKKLAEPRPTMTPHSTDVSDGSRVELWRMKSLAEMCGLWIPEKHRVLPAGKTLKPGVFK